MFTRIFSTYCICSFFILTLNAQSHRGFTGDVFVGPVYNSGSGLQKELRINNAANSDLSLKRITVMLGGDVYLVGSSEIVVGAGGFTYHFSSGNADGKASQSLSAGFFKFGYCYFNKEKWLAFPYAGIGGYATHAGITNTTASKVFRISTDTIMSGGTVNYSTNGLAGDLGISFKFFREPGKKMSAALAGIDIGTSLFFNGRKWKNTSTESQLDFSNEPLVIAPYIKCIIGFRVFDKKKISTAQ